MKKLLWKRTYFLMLQNTCIHERFLVQVPIVLVFPFLSNKAALMHHSIAILPIFSSARQILVLFNFVFGEAPDTFLWCRFITKNWQKNCRKENNEIRASLDSRFRMPFIAFLRFILLLIIKNMLLEKYDKDENFGGKSTLWEI